MKNTFGQLTLFLLSLLAGSITANTACAISITKEEGDQLLCHKVYKHEKKDCCFSCINDAIKIRELPFHQFTIMKHPDKDYLCVRNHILKKTYHKSYKFDSQDKYSFLCFLLPIDDSFLLIMREKSKYKILLLTSQQENNTIKAINQLASRELPDDYDLHGKKLLYTGTHVLIMQSSYNNIQAIPINY